MCVRASRSCLSVALAQGLRRRHRPSTSEASAMVKQRSISMVQELAKQYGKGVARAPMGSCRRLANKSYDKR
eukprot:11215501-Lingulodinium_polyedra.AAC.1